MEEGEDTQLRQEEGAGEVVWVTVEERGEGGRGVKE